MVVWKMNVKKIISDFHRQPKSGLAATDSRRGGLRLIQTP